MFDKEPREGYNLSNLPACSPGEIIEIISKDSP
jgi:hypothetical protein